MLRRAFYVLRGRIRNAIRYKRSGALLCIRVLLFVGIAAFAAIRLISLSGRAFRTEEENLLNKTVNECIKEVFSGRDETLLAFAGTEKYGQSRVDEAKLNLLRGTLSVKLSEALENKSVLKIGIPAGSLFPGGVFAGRGPKITQKAFVSSSVKTDLRSVFESGGVNQTLYSMYLDVEIAYECVSPFTKQDGSVSTSVLVFSEVIVGEVPSVYPFLSDR